MATRYSSDSLVPSQQSPLRLEMLECIAISFRRGHNVTIGFPRLDDCLCTLMDPIERNQVAAAMQRLGVTNAHPHASFLGRLHEFFWI